VELHDEVTRRRSRLDLEHEIEDWISLVHFPDDARVNLTLPGRRFIFQNVRMQKALGPVVSRTQWSRYRSNPEMTIPLSTLRILVDNSRELFMTSFTVTTIGNKKIQLPIKLPIRTRSNSVAKLLALLTLSKNVFLTGTYQTDQQGKIKTLIETFDSVFDVNLCPDGEIAQNQRGFYVKIPTSICAAIVKAFTGEFQASFPQIILSVSKCKDEQDILDFVTTWLKFSRLYRFEGNEETLFMFRYNDETREVVKLIDKLGVKYETASIWDRGAVVPVYRIPNVADNKVILDSLSLVSRLKAKITNQEARIDELETIKEGLEVEIEGATEKAHEKLSWSRAIDERLAEDLSEKLNEFERILVDTRRENDDLKQILRDRGIVSPKELISDENSSDNTLSSDMAQLRDEVNRLKDRLANIKPLESVGKELSYKITKEITMKAENQSIGMNIDLKPLVKAFLASPDNWILFILGTNETLSKEQIRKILGINVDNIMDLQKRLNDLVDKRILKVVESSGEERFQLDSWENSDLLSSYSHTILGNKEDVPLNVKQLVRHVLR